jgi:hypothetical protein
MILMVPFNSLRVGMIEMIDTGWARLVSGDWEWALSERQDSELGENWL